MPNFNYDDLLGRVRNRRLDPMTKTAQVSENFSRDHYPKSLRYVIESMSPVGKRSTEIYHEEADRVKAQLQAMPGYTLDFDLQGSVPLDIHIRTVSDIDLLCINTSFYIPVSVQAIPPGQVVTGADCRTQQRRLRTDATSKLTRAYYTADVDGTSCGKAIKVSGGSLQRNIDVVITNWHDTQQYVITGRRMDRAIDAYDLHDHDLIFNHPFLHMERVNEQDQTYLGAHKRYVRLLKCIKEDFNVDGLTSYDITSMIYHMRDERLYRRHGILESLQFLESFLWELHEKDELRESLSVPNLTRKIFEWKAERKQGLHGLWLAVYQIIEDMKGQVVWKVLQEGRMVDAI